MLDNLPFKIAIDDLKLSAKPPESDKVTGARINNNLAKINNQKTTSLKDLGEAIKQGRSFCVAELDGNGRKETNFKSCQIIAMDIDNKVNRQNITAENSFYLSCQSAIAKFNAAGININAWYYSFSNSKETEKFRLIILLDKPITSPVNYRKIYTALMRFCPQIDTAAQDPTRLFFGSNNFTLLSEKPSSCEKILSICPPEPITKPLPPKPLNYAIENINESITTTHEAVKYLYNTVSDRTQWRSLGLAIAELGESGRSAFIDLSLNQAGYDDDLNYLNRVYDDLLRSWKPGGLSHKTIIELAQKNGFINPLKAMSRKKPEEIKSSYEEDCLNFEEKKPTDYTIAKVLHSTNNHNFVFNHAKKIWLKWNGKYWQEDTTGSINKTFLDLSQKILKQAAETNDRDIQEKLLMVRKDLENAKNWTGYLSVYKTICGVDNNKFNQHSNYLINLNNGTYDLNKMQFREHKKSDYLTDCLPYDYDIHAECNKWIEYLEDVFNWNQDMIAFIQRAIGYTLTGLATEQHFFFLHGTGSNGKSVFIETLAALLSSYAVKIPMTALLQTKNNTESAREIIRLKDKRLAFANEIEEGVRFSESIIKDLTGGDTLTGKALYESTVEFKPTHKLWIYGNHKPLIKGTDPGIWRRPLLIPFTVSIPEEKKDKQLPEKLTKELSGIFNWALIGLQNWKSQGLKPIPAAVQLSTSEYKTTMDLVGNFLSECTEQITGINTSQKELYASFKQWQMDSGDNTRMTSRALTGKLEERGLKSYKGAGNATYWENLEIKND